MSEAEHEALFMKTLKFSILLILSSVVTAAADEPAVSLDKARELGRTKSRFLKETPAETRTAPGIPTADTASFQKLVGPTLKKSCLACHGPDKSEGRLRVDKLDPDLLTGADVSRWREVYNVLSNSEMPPEDEEQYALADADRGPIVDWLSGELNKASRIRRNSKQHSSFRRLTKYEYNYALQDLLGLSHPLAEKLPPEATTEDGFKNSSELDACSKIFVVPNPLRIIYLQRQIYCIFLRKFDF